MVSLRRIGFTQYCYSLTAINNCTLKSNIIYYPVYFRFVLLKTITFYVLFISRLSSIKIYIKFLLILYKIHETG